MTSYELIGLLIGFGILLATAAMWVAVLNALDEGTHGCSRECPDVGPFSWWENGKCESCGKEKDIHVGYGECESCLFMADMED